MLYKVSIKFLSKESSGALTYVQFILKMLGAADITLALSQVMGMRAAKTGTARVQRLRVVRE